MCEYFTKTKRGFEEQTQVSPFLTGRLCRVLLLWVLTLVCGVGSAQAVVYDAVKDFSTASSTNGAWRYGYYATGSDGEQFRLYTTNMPQPPPYTSGWAYGGAPSVLRNTSSSQLYSGVLHPQDLLNLHPGPYGEKSVLRWIAPTAGTFKIEGRFEGISLDGTTTDVTIKRGTTFPLANPLQTGAINSYGGQVSILREEKVAAGEIIDFIVGYGNGNYYSDSTGLGVTITPVDVDTGTGLTGEYFAQQNFTDRRLSRVDPTVNFNYGQGPPPGTSSFPSDYFSVRWTGQVKPRFSETYTFLTDTDDGVKLWVNGQLISNVLAGQPGSRPGATIALKAGVKYDIRMDYFETFGAASAKLSWRSPSQVEEVIPQGRLYPTNLSSGTEPGSGAGTGLTGEYFAQSSPPAIDESACSGTFDPAGCPAGTSSAAGATAAPNFTRLDAQVNFDFGVGSVPGAPAGFPNDNFSVRWRGQLRARYSENYTFHTTTDNGVQLWVNNVLVINAGGPNTGAATRNSTVAVSLVAGQLYDIKMEFSEGFGEARAFLSWSSPSQSQEVIPQSQLYPYTQVLNVTDPSFGAIPNDGMDDTDAFLKLTNKVNCLGGGVRVVIPAGQYKVGRQRPNAVNCDDGLTYRYDGTSIMLFKNCAKPVLVEGYGATLKHPDGMRFGAFDAAGNPITTGEVAGAAGITGFMVGGAGCQNLTFKGLELNGNNTQYHLGGNWGPQGRQTRSYGLYFIGCDNVSVEDVSAHHFGLDGVYIKYPGQTETAPAHPHSFSNCDFQYNGRQGISWSGGKGLSATDCKFNNTGYALNTFGGDSFPNGVVSNGPGAGLDIEEEQDGVCRMGEFLRCEFIHNAGPSLYAPPGRVRANEPVTLKVATFKDCTFSNNDNYALEPNYPRLDFFNCKIYGATTSAYQDADPSNAPKFYGCHFEDKSDTFLDGYGAMTSFSKFGMKGLLFQDCSFVNNRSPKAIFIRKESPGGSTDGFEMNRCTVVNRQATADHVEIGTLEGGTISNTRFLQTAPSSTGGYIYPPSMRVGTGVVVNSPLHWGDYGPSGVITPTP